MAANPFDPAAMAALAEGVSATAAHEETLVKATAQPHGVITELQIEPALHDLGTATAAAEILAVVRSAQAQADAELQERVQSHLAATMTQFGGGQA
ncbi:MAG TPA: YbaB/EbfC family nucleoid-associated protein [Glycomyces sp.]|nr:YbaB/EbfC family nucleoid-associated protein [Glycomyces sp.]